MADDVGPRRSDAGLRRALATMAQLTGMLGDRPMGDGRPYDMRRLDWFDLRNMLMVAHAVTEAALRRTESRGAHQREDCSDMRSEWRVNQIVRLRGDRVELSTAAVAPELAAQ